MRAALLLGSLSLAACQNTLPSAGPSATRIETISARQETVSHELIDVDPRVLAALRRYRSASLLSSFGSKPGAPAQRISVGDQVSITIYEASAGGLFSGGVTGGPSQGSTTLPVQSVDQDGMLTVPYAGRVRVAGRSTAQVSRDIVEKLQNKATEPQVIVTLAQPGSGAVTVIGDATGSARVPLNPKGDRILEVVAQAGGVKTLPHETFIRLIRAGGAQSISMQAILADPRENIFVQPGDTLYVSRNTPKFTALGAVAAQKDFPIDKDPMTLAEAIARAGGLMDSQADSGAVFLFRFERPDIIRAILPDSNLLGHFPEGVPTIYRLKFDHADAYFQAKEMKVLDNDLIFVANAPSVEFMKFVGIVRAVLSTGAAARSTSLIVN